MYSRAAERIMLLALKKRYAGMNLSLLLRYDDAYDDSYHMPYTKHLQTLFIHLGTLIPF